MAAGEQIALEPALAGVFGEDLHHTTLTGEMFVYLLDLGQPYLVGHLEHRAEPVGLGLVRPDQPEIAMLLVRGHHIA